MINKWQFLQRYVIWKCSWRHITQGRSWRNFRFARGFRPRFCTYFPAVLNCYGKPQFFDCGSYNKLTLAFLCVIVFCMMQVRHRSKGTGCIMLPYGQRAFPHYASPSFPPWSHSPFPGSLRLLQIQLLHVL